MEVNKGPLYLIPTRLGDNAPLEVLPISVKKVVEMVDDYIVENEKTARRFIKKISAGKSQPSLNINILNKYLGGILCIRYCSVMDPCEFYAFFL